MASQVVILSPHRDDAAFSCGLLMTLCLDRGIPVRIVNVFTRSAYAPYLPVAEGMEPLEAVSAARQEEDGALLQRLGPGCAMEDLDLTDAPVRLGLPVERVLAAPLSGEEMQAGAEELASQLREHFGDEQTLLFAPLALGGHVDHALVRQAALLAVPCEQLALYEDLPYAARLDEGERTAAIRAVLGEVAAAEPIVVPAGENSGGPLKRELAELYPSQIDSTVAEEMAGYAEQIGGERFYACAGRSDWIDGMLRTGEDAGTERVSR